MHLEFPSWRNRGNSLQDIWQKCWHCLASTQNCPCLMQFYMKKLYLQGQDQKNPDFCLICSIIWLSFALKLYFSEYYNHFYFYDLILYNYLSLSWVESQHIFLTFSWDETEYYLKRSCVYKLKMISCNSTLCLFLWIFISAKSQEIMLSFNSTQTQTIVNNQVIN